MAAASNMAKANSMIGASISFGPAEDESCREMSSTLQVFKNSQRSMEPKKSTTILSRFMREQTQNSSKAF